MSTNVPTLSMTRFADFCASDPVSQLTKVRETRRQYEQPYTPSSDFWSRWRAQVEDIHRRREGRDAVERVGGIAKDNRAEQYISAAEGYRRFWGRKRIEFLGGLKPAIWTHDRLKVRVNPEWLLNINGTPTIIKLHLKARLPLNQRLANPLLHLLDVHFGIPERAVAIVDVHRGNLWSPTAESRTMDSVLRMQAAGFLVGWDASERRDVA